MGISAVDWKLACTNHTTNRRDSLFIRQEAADGDRQLRDSEEQWGIDLGSPAGVVTPGADLAWAAVPAQQEELARPGVPLPSLFPWALPARAEGKAALWPARETWLHRYPWLISRRRICIPQEMSETAAWDVGDTRCAAMGVSVAQDRCTEVLVRCNESVAQR